ncbi:growth-regulated alpha protein-like [Pholidichthys leucotaenia]
MMLHLHSIIRLVLLTLCCVLITVKESDSQFVPGRCLCPQTQSRVRGQLKDLTVLPKSASCHTFTVIVTLKNNNMPVCLNPDAPIGKQLIRCWSRAQKLGRDVKLCLRRMRRRGRQHQRPQQRRRSRSRKASLSNP